MKADDIARVIFREKVQLADLLRLPGLDDDDPEPDNEDDDDDLND